MEKLEVEKLQNSRMQVNGFLFSVFLSQVGGANNGLIRDPLSHTTKETDPISKDRRRMNNIKETQGSF